MRVTHNNNRNDASRTSSGKLESLNRPVVSCHLSLQHTDQRTHAHVHIKTANLSNNLSIFSSFLIALPFACARTHAITHDTHEARSRSRARCRDRSPAASALAPIRTRLSTQCSVVTRCKPSHTTRAPSSAIAGASMLAGTGGGSSTLGAGSDRPAPCVGV
jgi:hypothetical protein